MCKKKKKKNNEKCYFILKRTFRIFIAIRFQNAVNNLIKFHLYVRIYIELGEVSNILFLLLNHYTEHYRFDYVNLLSVTIICAANYRYGS